MKSYCKIAYWAVFLANDIDSDPNIEIFMKKFLYFFIIDLGVSPFIKCYEKKSIIQACIVSNRLDFLRELLTHEYEVLTEKDAEILKISAKGKDINGDNIYHEIFKKKAEIRNKYLEVILDKKYFLKIFVKSQEKSCCSRGNKVKLNEELPELISIGDMHKRNKNSIEPCEFEHEQPI
jgi:hypothetical protein